jgi:hypothetical protein
MKSQLLIHFIILFLISCLNTPAQGIFVEKNEVGFYLNSGYSGVQNGHAISYGIGVAVGEMLEFSYSHSNATLKNQYYSQVENIEIGSNTVALGIFLLKNNLQAFIGYSGTDQQPSGSLLFGFEAGGKIFLYPTLFWYPSFSFALTFPDVSLTEDPVTTLSVSSPFLIGKHFYVGPSFAVSEGNTTWGGFAGILFTFDIRANDKIK